MRRTSRFAAALLAVVTLVACQQVTAAEVTFFGDFEDGFGPGPTYTSFDVPEPGSFFLAFDEPILGIPKFDPSLGTLTDITVFVEDTDPIMYDVAGDIMATEIDPLDSGGFDAGVDVSGGDVGINYEDPSGLTLSPVITDSIDLMGSCGDTPGSGDCGESLFSSAEADGVLEGSSSIFGTVDLADFVGPGDVDSLFVQIFLPTTAMFTTMNADAVVDFDLDVFAGFSVIGEDIVGVTYTFTPIPEPTSLLLAAPALALLVAMRRRK